MVAIAGIGEMAKCLDHAGEFGRAGFEFGNVGECERLHVGTGTVLIAPKLQKFAHAVDVRYVGQEYTLTIPLLGAGEPLEAEFDQAVSDRFHAAHLQRFGHANPGAPVEFVVVRSTALGDLGRIEPSPREEPDTPVYPATTAEVIFGRGAQPTQMIQRDDLPVGSVVDGPAIVSEATATTVVPPGATLQVDPFGSLAIAVGKE